MHITVSVVVIMFELTGALTYILPTMVCPLPTLPYTEGDSELTKDRSRLSLVLQRLSVTALAGVGSRTE